MEHPKLLNLNEEDSTDFLLFNMSRSDLGIFRQKGASIIPR